MSSGVEFGGGHQEKLNKLIEATSYTLETGNPVASGEKESGKAALQELMEALND